MSRGWDTRPKLKTVLGVDLAPQRPRYARERAEGANHILEPDWVGKRALARVGHSGPHFVGYGGEVEGPRELYDAIVAEARCTTANRCWRSRCSSASGTSRACWSRA